MITPNPDAAKPLLLHAPHSVRVVNGTLVDETGKALTFGDGTLMCAFAPCPSCPGGDYCRVHGKPEHPHDPL